MNSENFQQIICNTRIVFHELFLLSFKLLPNSFYEINEFNSHIDDIIQKICSNFCTQFQINDEDSKEIIMQLSKDFLKCFRYELPPFYDIDIKQYKKNYTSVINDDKIIKINKKNSKKVYIKLNENEDENNEINFWLRDSDSEIDQLIKKKYYQTKYEIKSVYPSLKDIDSLCFFNYMEQIKKKLEKANELIFLINGGMTTCLTYLDTK